MGAPKSPADPPHYLGHRDRLRARFTSAGPEALAWCGFSIATSTRTGSCFASIRPARSATMARAPASCRR
ncbi:MAG: hypothetical protein EXQ98_07020 [Alphaproteobacteria bacterium]|nr:hypothetical protein [Alphaproteobacteria bacterium]